MRTLIFLYSRRVPSSHFLRLGIGLFIFLSLAQPIDTQERQIRGDIGNNIFYDEEIRDDEIELISTDLVDYCVHRTSCNSCVKRSSGCAWCYDSGICSPIDKVLENCDVDTAMNRALNSVAATDYPECAGISQFSQSWQRTREHVTATCGGRISDLCERSKSNCLKCKIEDQDLLKDAFKWIRSALCATDGVETYNDIYTKRMDSKWTNQGGQFINIQSMIRVLNDGLWTESDLPSEYCDALNCCKDTTMGGLVLDKFRMIPDLSFCDDDWSWYPSRTNYCDHRLDTIRREDDESTQLALKAWPLVGPKLRAKRVALKILMQLETLSELGSLRFLSPAVTGPFYTGKYPEVTLCEYDDCIEVNGQPTTDPDWLESYGFVLMPQYDIYWGATYDICILLVFYIGIPLLPMLILKIRNYTNRKRYVSERNISMKRINEIRARRATNTIRDTDDYQDYRERVALAYIEGRMLMDPLNTKLAQVQRDEKLRDRSTIGLSF